MDLIELNAQKRENSGRGESRALRRNGKVPAILYGPELEPIKLSIEVKELEQVVRKIKGGRVLLNLNVQNGNQTSYVAIFKELQRHPVSRSFIHADFYQVAMDRKIRVKIPVVTKGKCIGVEMGGMLQIIRRELEVSCFPNEIPDFIEVDVTDLNIGDAIHVKDIPLQGNIEIPTHVNYTVVTVLSTKEKEVKAVETEEEGAKEETPAAAEGEKAEKK